MASVPSQNERFDRIFAEHRDSIWAYCARRLPRDDVFDAVADVFLVMWRRIDDVPCGDEARLWVYGVARNVVRNKQRADRRRRRLDRRVQSVHTVSCPGSDLEIVRRAEDGELLAAVAQLSPDERELLRLRTWEELSLAEIARIVGSSVRAVESRLARVRKKLGTILDNPAPNPRRAYTPDRPGGER